MNVRNPNILTWKDYSHTLLSVKKEKKVSHALTVSTYTRVLYVFGQYMQWKYNILIQVCNYTPHTPNNGKYRVGPSINVGFLIYTVDLFKKEMYSLRISVINN